MTTPRLAALAVAASCFVAIPAAAANPNPALQEARDLTSKASVEYDVGHFDQALELYTRAYERYPKPALLFDIGQCHRQLGHYERAIFFYQGYLRGQPNAPNRALVEKFLADSQQALDAQRSAAAASAPAPSAPPSPEPTTTATTPAPPSPADTAAPAGATTPSKGMSSLQIAGLATAGAGVVLLVSAVVEGVQASSLQNQISQIASTHGTWSTQAQSEYDGGKSDATIANVLYVTGAVALAAGGVLTWFGWPRASSASAAIAPLPGGGSVTLVSAF